MSMQEYDDFISSADKEEQKTSEAQEEPVRPTDAQSHVPDAAPVATEPLHVVGSHETAPVFSQATLDVIAQ